MSVESAMILGREGKIKEPYSIVVKEGGKWPEIVGYDFEKPDRGAGQLTLDIETMDDFMPF